MALYELKDRRVLRLKPNAAKFLKGMSTNLIDAPQNAFVDVQGRALAVFDQYKVSDNEAFLVVAEPFVEGLKKHLKMYLDLNDATLENTSLRVYFDLTEHVILNKVKSLDFARDPELVEGDPKYDLRSFDRPGGLSQDDIIFIPQKAGRLLLTEENLKTDVTDAEFTLFRLHNNIPFQGLDFCEEMLLNIDENRYVSFTKGCFLGQEVLARVHNRSKPPQKLVVLSEEEVAALREAPLRSMTSKCKDPGSGKTLGFIFIKNE